MLVMQEFANKSIELAEVGSIIITENTWASLCQEAGLPKSIFKQTLDRWLNDGDDGPRFLILLGKARYSFGPAYKREEAFQKEQGELRKLQQERGKKSISKKANR